MDYCTVDNTKIGDTVMNIETNHIFEVILILGKFNFIVKSEKNGNQVMTIMSEFYKKDYS